MPPYIYIRYISHRVQHFPLYRFFTLVDFHQILLTLSLWRFPARTYLAGILEQAHDDGRQVAKLFRSAEHSLSLLGDNAPGIAYVKSATAATTTTTKSWNRQRMTKNEHTQHPLTPCLLP